MAWHGMAWLVPTECFWRALEEKRLADFAAKRMRLQQLGGVAATVFGRNSSLHCIGEHAEHA
jgi:hypothetical protein